MRGSVKWQVNTIFKAICKIGQSRHEAKQSVSYSNPHELGQQIGIFSYKTLDTYKNVAKDLLLYSKTTNGVKDIEKISSDIVKSYLENKLSEGVSYNTLKTYCAAVNKLAVALKIYNGKEYNFYEATQEVLKTTKEESGGPTSQHRAFEDPEKVIENIQNESFKTIAQFQLASGLRLSELNHIRPEQLREENGKYYVDVFKGKGGKDRVVEVRDKQAFESFKNMVEQNKQTSGRYKDKFCFDKFSYTKTIREAAKEAGERVTRSGSHCFRWNFAQRRFNSYQIDNGYSRKEALQKVSEDLGHNRPEITEHYLQKLF